MLAKRWKDIGSLTCRRSHLSSRIAWPNHWNRYAIFITRRHRILCYREHSSTCRPLNSIWKFFALSWVTLPPKSSWYTWLDSFHIGALLCITSSRLTDSDLWLDDPPPFCFNYTLEVRMFSPWASFFGKIDFPDFSTKYFYQPFVATVLFETFRGSYNSLTNHLARVLPRPSFRLDSFAFFYLAKDSIEVFS